jgi:hypothetical protein
VLDARLDLGVAVCAQQDAFPSLGPCGVDAAGNALAGQREALLRWDAMVKLECCDAAVVSAEGARSTGLVDEDALHPPPAVGDLLLATQLAAICAAWVEAEAHKPVLRARTVGEQWRQRGIDVAPPTVRSWDLPFAEPVADGRDRAFQLHGDLNQLRAASSKCLQSAPIGWPLVGKRGHGHIRTYVPKRVGRSGEALNFGGGCHRAVVRRAPRPDLARPLRVVRVGEQAADRQLHSAGRVEPPRQ